MEAAPRLPMVSLEPKESQNTPNFGTVFRHYLMRHYGEAPSAYDKEIAELDNRRFSAVKAQKDSVGLEALKRYFFELKMLYPRFPMGENEPAAVEFTWRDNFTTKDVKSTDPKFEEANILYNIGAVHSVLGTVDTRKDSDSMKMSCQHFQYAAGAFERIRTDYPQMPSFDQSYDVLTFYITLMLAQAHECILEKSLLDNRKNIIIAKVSAQVVEYYKELLRTLDSEATLRMPGMENFKDFIPRQLLELKVSYYQGMMFYHMAGQSEEGKKYGEMIGFLEATLKELENCRKIVKQTGDDECALAETFVRDIAQQKLNAAKRDNDFIYHEKIIDVATLPAVKGTAIGKAIRFNEYEYLQSSKEGGAEVKVIFERLLPMTVYERLSLYSTKKDAILREAADTVQWKDGLLMSVISALRLEQLKIPGDLNAVPQSLLNSMASLRSEGNIQKIISQESETLNEMTEELRKLISDIENTLELLKNTRLEKNQSVEVEGLRKEVGQYASAFSSAVFSTDDLFRLIFGAKDSLFVLSGSVESLRSKFPSLDNITKNENVTTDLAELSKLLSGVDKMKAQREDLLTDLKTQLESDDVTKRILIPKNDELDVFLTNELKKHDEKLAFLKQNLEAQDEIVSRLTIVVDRLADFRASLISARTQREEMLKVYEEAFHSYDNFTKKIAEGLEFYRTLKDSLTKTKLKVEDLFKQTPLGLPKPKLSQPPPPTSDDPSLRPTQGVHGPQGGQGGPRLGDYMAQPKYPNGTQVYSAGPVAPPAAKSGRPTLKDYLDAKKNNQADTQHPQQNVPFQPASQPATVSGYEWAPAPTPSFAPVSDPQYGSQHHGLTQGGSTQQYQPSHGAQGGGSQQYQPSQLTQGGPSQHYQPSHGGHNTQDGTSQYYQSSQGGHGTQGATSQYHQPSQDGLGTPSGTTQYYQPTQGGQGTQGGTSQFYQPSHGTQGITSLQYQPSHSVQGTLGGNTQYYQPAGPYQPVPVNPTRHYQPPVKVPALRPPTVRQPPPPPCTTPALFSGSLGGSVPTQAGSYYVGAPQGQPSHGQPVHGSSQQYQQPVNSGAHTGYPPAPQQAAYGHIQAQPPGLGYVAGFSQVTGGQTAWQGAGGANYQSVPAGSMQPALPGQSPGPGSQFSSTQGDPQGTWNVGQGNPSGQIYSQGNPAADGGFPGSYAQQSVQPNQPGHPHVQPSPGSGWTPTVTPPNAGAAGMQHMVSGSQTSSHQTPTHQTPTHQTPTHQTPTHQTPTHQTPSHQTPTHQTPSHQTPSLQTPSFQTLIPENPRSFPLSGASLPMQPIPAVPMPVRQVEPPSPIDDPPMQNLGGVSTTPVMTPRHDRPSLSTLRSTDEMLSTSPGVNEDFHILQPQILTIEDIKRLKNQQGPQGTQGTQGTQGNGSQTDVFGDRGKLEGFEKQFETFEATASNLEEQKTLWKSLQDQQARDAAKHLMGVARCFPKKNRNVRIMPFDSSRVILQNAKDDYINASFVEGISDFMPRIIATQTPLSNTFSDFWTMIVEQNVEVIAAIMTDYEVKEFSYWPVSRHAPLSFGAVTVSLQKESAEEENWTMRLFSVSHSLTKVTKSVIHLLFRGWPSSDVPEKPFAFASFIREVMQYQQKQRVLTKPAVIHCQFGTGPTGIFCGALAFAYSMDAGGGVANLRDVICSLRNCRKFLIDSLNELSFLYHVCLTLGRRILHQHGRLPDYSEAAPRQAVASSKRSDLKSSILAVPDVLSDIREELQRRNVSPSPPDSPAVRRLSNQSTAGTTSSLQKTDSQKMDFQKTTPQKTTPQKTDSQKTDSQKTDLQKNESQKTNSQKTDSQKTNSLSFLSDLPQNFANLATGSFNLDPEVKSFEKKSKITKESFSVRIQLLTLKEFLTILCRRWILFGNLVKNKRKFHSIFCNFFFTKFFFQLNFFH